MEPNNSLSSFDVVCGMGGGGQALVYKAQKLCGKDKDCFFALKVADALTEWKLETIGSDMEAEFKLMEKFNNPFILKARYFFKDTKYLYLAMDLMLPLGDVLRSKLRKLKPVNYLRVLC